MAEPDTVVQVNYYADRITIGTGASVARTRMFDRDAGTTEAWNDLKKGGKLPDNRQAQITGIMFRVHNPRTDQTGSKALDESVDAMGVIENLWATIFVNNVEITRGPIQAFPHPPIWHSLVFHEGTNSDKGSYLTQNGGYMLFFQNIFVGSQQRIRVEVESRATISPAIGTALDLSCILQTLDEKLA